MNLKLLKAIITFTLLFFHFSFGALILFDASILFGFKQYILSLFNFVLSMTKGELQLKCYQGINFAKGGEENPFRFAYQLPTNFSKYPISYFMLHVLGIFEEIRIFC